MTARYFGLIVALALGLPTPAAAQTQASITGIVTDTSQAVLPGVTVTAVDLAGGRRYVAHTDQRGEYRLGNLAPGTYRIVAELSGFATASVPGVEVLVGQNIAMGFTLQVGSLQETVTVTSEAALVDLVSSQVAGNVDRRQMDELPILGRNWMELGMLVKGVTVNSVSQYEPQGVSRNHEFQLNLDGQQITQLVASSAFGQPRSAGKRLLSFKL